MKEIKCKRCDKELWFAVEGRVLYVLCSYCTQYQTFKLGNIVFTTPKEDEEEKE